MRAVLLDGDAVREIRAPSEPVCAQLLAGALQQEVDSRSEAMKLLDDQLASSEAEVASARAELLAFRERESLLSISLAEQLELQRRRVAQKKRPSPADSEALRHLERLIIQEAQLLRSIESAEQRVSIVAEKRAEQLLAAPRVRLLEPCGACPTPARTDGRTAAPAAR